jgi:iron complex outermembrane receptor protein
MIRRFGPSCAVLGAFGVVSLLATPVSAQTENAQSTQTTGTPQGGLEEVFVTAQKHREKLQDVPIAVEALTSNDLLRANITEAQDLGKLSPSLNILAATGIIEPYIRGIGNSSHTAANEASVPFYIDGIYVSRLQQSYLEFNDIEQIEVLPGPQGTLFGRNASAGAVTITTKDPTQAPTLHAEAGYGNFDTSTAKIYAATGITSNLSADVALLYRNQGDGWGTNLYNGTKFGYENHEAGRTKWLFTPSDDTQVRVSADYSQSKNDLGVPRGVAEGTRAGSDAPAGTLLPIVPGFYDADQHYNGYNTDYNWGVNGRIDHQFADVNVSSITGYMNGKGTSTLDLGFDPQQSGIALLGYTNQQWSQELQLQSNDRSPVKWIVGLFAMDELAGYDPAIEEGGPLAAPPGDSLKIYGMQRTQTYAAYGQATIPVMEHSDITLGARYSIDRLSANGRVDLVTPAVVVHAKPEIDPDKKYFKPNYRLAFDHHFTDSIMGYISTSTGFKDGTFNTLPLGPTPVAPELVTSYEVGAKSEFFDRRLQFDGSLFYSELKNPQVQEVLTNLVTLVNAGAAEIKGAEFNLRGKLTKDLSLHAGAQFLDAYYTSFPDAPRTSQNPNPPYGNVAATPFNASGYALPNAPDTTFNIGADYDIPTDSLGSGKLSINYAYNSGFYFFPDHTYKQQPYGLLDAQAKWRLPGDQWGLSVWGKNLLGSKYYLVVNEEFTPQGYAPSPAAPLTFGVTISYDM